MAAQLIAAGGLGLLLLVLMLAGPAAPAQAHDPCVGMSPKDPSVVCIRSYHTRIDVCDRDPDGHSAYARITTYASWPYQIDALYDKDGYGGFCNWGYFASSGVYQYNVCVQYEGCGSPKYIWWP